jgi:hypothetical protein
MHTIKKYIAPFEVINYTREDGNQAVYKVFRLSKHLFRNKKKDENQIVGFKAWKLANTGANQKAGWRSFRFDRINEIDLAFF